MLPLRPLGRTDLTTTALGFGAGHIGSPDMPDAEAGRLLNEVLDLGITLIDTAPGYGLSEARIGEFIRHRRAEFTLVSKCGYGVPGVEDWTPEAITQGVDQALQRMGTERIDVMLFHSCPAQVLNREGLVDALERARREGKVGAVGYSGENDDLAAALGTQRMDVIETSVNAFDQRGLAWAVPQAAERGLGVIGKRPLGNAPWRYGDRPVGQYAEEYWMRMHAMQLDLQGMEWGEFALRFAAYQPGVSTVIVGTGNMVNLRRNVEWVDRGPLPDALLAHAQDAFKAHDQGWVGQI